MAAVPPGVRAAYRNYKNGQAILYINGEEFDCSLTLAQALCSGKDPLTRDASRADQNLLDHLTNQGHLV